MQIVSSLINIPPLVLASTTQITMAATYQGMPANIPVMGQAYVPTSTVTLNTASTGLNGMDTGVLAIDTLYYIYGVVSGGVFGLVLSTNGTSPAGFSQYNLLGKCRTRTGAASIVAINNIIVGNNRYSNGDTEWASLGALVASNIITSNTVTMSGSGAAPGLGSVIAWNNTSWRHIRDTIQLRVSYSHTAAGTIGNGTYTIVLPLEWQIDISKVSDAGNSSRELKGDVQLEDGATTYIGTAQIAHAAGWYFSLNNATSNIFPWASTTVSMANATIRFGCQVEAPIREWNGVFT